MSSHHTVVPSHRFARSTSAIRSGLIEWTLAQPGLWSGRIGLDFAGLVELHDDAFTVSDWKGDSLGVFDSLDEAKLALEPAHRAQLRDAAERSAARVNLIVTGVLLVATLASASAVGAWLTSMM